MLDKAIIVGVVVGLLLVAGCTTGRLEYVTPEGETRYACETEYTWQPSVDKYAVEYILAYCARQAEKKGNRVVRRELLTLDLTIADPPPEKQWSHELAEAEYEADRLTDKQYGYILAFLDLGLDQSDE